MRYLLDTHALIWLITHNENRLPVSLCDSMKYYEDEFAISEMSLIEIIQLQQINVRAKRGSKPLTSKEMKTAEAFIQKYYPNIVEKWVNYFVKKQNVRKTTIKTKL